MPPKSSSNNQDRFPGLSPQSGSGLPDIEALIRARQQQRQQGGNNNSGGTAPITTTPQQQQKQANTAATTHQVSSGPSPSAVNVNVASGNVNGEPLPNSPTFATSDVNNSMARTPTTNTNNNARSDSLAFSDDRNNNNNAVAIKMSSGISNGNKQQHSLNKYAPIVRSGLDNPVAPFAGVVAQDVVDTEDQDDEQDALPPAEQAVWMGLVPASHVQMPLGQQARRIPFFFLFCITIQCFCLNFTTRRMPDPKTELQLPDLLFDIIPRDRDLEKVTAMLLLGMNILSGLCILGLYQIAHGRQPPHEHPHVRGLTPRRYIHLIAWMRWWGTFAVASILRAITVSMTILPATNNQCKERPEIDNIWLNTLKGIYSMGSGNVHCGDLLFSGHTVAIMNSFMLCWTYGPVISTAFRPLVTIISLGAYYCVISSRSHYTDDIVVAQIVVYAIFTMFGHNSKQGAPLWIQALLRPINTIKHIRAASALPQQSTTPLVSDLDEEQMMNEVHPSAAGGNNNSNRFPGLNTISQQANNNGLPDIEALMKQRKLDKEQKEKEQKAAADRFPGLQPQAPGGLPDIEALLKQRQQKKLQQQQEEEEKKKKAAAIAVVVSPSDDTGSDDNNHNERSHQPTTSNISILTPPPPQNPHTRFNSSPSSIMELEAKSAEHTKTNSVDALFAGSYNNHE